jgi:putative heme-binding domain-containing protein
VFNAILKLASDDALRVRMQVAFTLGERQDARIAPLLSALVKRDGATPAILIAALSSMPQHAEAKQWQALLKEAQKTGSAATAPKIITNVNADREKVVKAYSGVTSLMGDTERGHAIYTAVCSACHRLKNEGFEIGPELSTIASKPTEQLLEAILDPSRAVEQRYLAQTLTLKDGKTMLGMIAEETANSITLKLGGTTEVILRSAIAKIEASTKSMTAATR